MYYFSAFSETKSTIQGRSPSNPAVFSMILKILYAKNKWQFYFSLNPIRGGKVVSQPSLRNNYFQELTSTDIASQNSVKDFLINRNKKLKEETINYRKI